MLCLLLFYMFFLLLYILIVFELCGNLLFDKLYNYLNCVNLIKGYYLCSIIGVYVGNIFCIKIVLLCLIFYV